MTAPRLAFVGTGPVARALAISWAQFGGIVVTVLSRELGRAVEVASRCGAAPSTDMATLAGADVVVVCVPDRAIAETGSRIVAALCRGGAQAPLLLHTSGSLPGTELLAGAALASDAPPMPVGSIHPLQSFPSRAPELHAAESEALVGRVAGVHWFHEGAGAAECRAMVSRWRGTFHELAPGGKSLYHAGAAVLSNHAVALFADATRLFAAAGVPATESRPALAALLAGTTANLAEVGVPAALTGPVARGDLATVRRHLEALGIAAPDLLDAYRAMARRVVVVALAKGSIDAPTATAVLGVLGAPARSEPPSE